MTHTQDEHHCWITSPLFGNVRLQHYNGVIEAVDDGRFMWLIGKTITDSLGWVKKKEVEDAEKRQKESSDKIKLDEERLLWHEEERKREAIWNEDHWVCGEGGEGHYDPGKYEWRNYPK